VLLPDGTGTVPLRAPLLETSMDERLTGNELPLATAMDPVRLLPDALKR
jgi:hypothetical protein